MQTIGRTSIGTARKDDNRIDQAGGTIRCDKSRESYGANGCRNSLFAQHVRILTGASP